MWFERVSDLLELFVIATRELVYQLPSIANEIARLSGEYYPAHIEEINEILNFHNTEFANRDDFDAEFLNVYSDVNPRTAPTSAHRRLRRKFRRLLREAHPLRRSILTIEAAVEGMQEWRFQLRGFQFRDDVDSAFDSAAVLADSAPRWIDIACENLHPHVGGQLGVFSWISHALSEFRERRVGDNAGD